MHLGQLAGALNEGFLELNKFLREEEIKSRGLYELIKGRKVQVREGKHM